MSIPSSILNILLTGDQEVTEDYDETINLIEENLFKLRCLIKANGIRLFTKHEYQGKELIAFTVATGDLCLYYVQDSSQPPIIKNIPWYVSPNKAISALCFDPSGYWLLIAGQDGSLHIIPAAGLVDAKRKTNQQKWKDTEDIISLTSNNSQTSCSKPSALIWWQCMSTSCHTGIIGTEQGEVLFIDLDTGQQVGLTRISGCISNFQICQDTELDTIRLIITSQSKNQWLFVLEQPTKGYVYTLNNETGAARSEDNGHTFISTIKKWQSKSRFRGLKQFSFDNFSILKKMTTKSKLDSSTLDSGADNSEGYSQCNGADSLLNPTLVNDLAILTVHYADHGQRLYSRYYPPKHILTMHENSSSIVHLCKYRLPDHSKDILLAQHLFYVTDQFSTRLSIISRYFSQNMSNGNPQFNQESVIAQISFGKKNEVINGLFVGNNNSKSSKENYFLNNEEVYTIPKMIKDLKIDLVPVNPCIVVTNYGIYRVTLRCSLLSILMDLIISRSELEKAKRLAKIFGLHVRELFEYAGDILLANNKFYQATALFQKAKCRPSKIFAKLASVGCTFELLSRLVYCLEHPSPFKLSIAERMSLSNLSIIAFTELSLWATTPKEQQIYKLFMQFLSTNMLYDELVAVSIIGQAHLWNILHHLVIKRGLFAQVLDILMKTLPLFFNFKNSHLNTNHDLLVTISEPVLIRGMVGNFSIAKTHMSFILANLSSLQVFALQRLILLYDPTNPVLRPIMARCKTLKRSDSRNSLSNSLEFIGTEEDMLNLAEKIVETFLMILLVLIHKKAPVLSHNADLMKMISLSEMKKSCKEATIDVQYKRRLLSAGFSHVTLLRNKSVYHWGNSITGCPGVGPATGSIYETPQEILMFRRIGIEVINVSSGHCHTLALTNNGIYAWGGNQFGQVGLENLTLCPTPQLISSLADEIIIDAVAGQYHSVALTSDGRVFTWGWGIHGQLGHDNVENLYIPSVVTSLLGICVKNISAGHAHTMVLSSESVVYVFGSNHVGQLGTTGSKKYLTPRIVDLLPEKISLIATKYFHNLAVTNTNKLYIWGMRPRELQRQQKSGDSDSEYVNRKQNVSPSSSVCSAESENAPSEIVKKDGDAQNCINLTNDQISDLLYSRDPQINKDDNKLVEDNFSNSNQKEPKNSENASRDEQGDQLTDSKLARPFWMPTLVDTTLVKGNIVQISAGWDHWALITKDGSVYIWGKNTSGQLGNYYRCEIERPTPLIYDPVSSIVEGLSVSQVPTKSAGRKSSKKGNGLIKNSTSSNHRTNVVKEAHDKMNDVDNNRVEKEEIDGNSCREFINYCNVDDEEDDSAFKSDVDEIREKFNESTDLNEKDIDDFESSIISKNSVIKAAEVSCGNNYTVAVQQGGTVLAWGKIVALNKKNQVHIQIQQCISNPTEVPNIPAPVISYQTYDTIPLVGFMPLLHSIEEVPGERFLHFTLEQFSEFYDSNKILKKCIALGNHQACAKLALMEHNFSESLTYQLKSLVDVDLKKEINSKETNVPELKIKEKKTDGVDLKEENTEDLKAPKDDEKEETSCEQIAGDEETNLVNSAFNDQSKEHQSMIKSSTVDNLNYDSLLFNESIKDDLVNSLEESVSKSKLKMSTSKSMDALSSEKAENELHTFNCQGGSEEMYAQADEDNNISDQLMTSSITFDYESGSDNSSERITGISDQENYNSQDELSSEVSCTKKAMSIVEFYINETENFNHAIVRDVLLKAISIWLELCLPLRYLEKVLLKNLDKIFYPLGLILFCQNDDDSNVSKAINSLSLRLTLNVCSVLLQHINEGKPAPEYVELLSQLVAKCFGPPLPGYPGSSENQTTEQMIGGIKSMLSSNENEPRPFILINDPKEVNRFLEMNNDVMVFTCGHFFPASSLSEYSSRMETELLVSNLSSTAEVFGRVFQQKGQIDTLCPQCIPRALQQVIKYSTES